MLIKTDICVIGAGSGGLSVAVAAAQMGANVVLIEGGKMGGDCLNTGCVPSKALITAAHSAHSARNASKFGLSPQDPTLNFKKVHDYVQSVIRAIAPHDSTERMESLGIQVIPHYAKFMGKNKVKAGEFTVRAKRFVIATGSSPRVPPIQGLSSVPFFTNETLFENSEKLDHLLIIGGGPIGIEMAQAHKRLGSKVSVFEMFSIMPNDDPEAVLVVRETLQKEGVSLYEGIEIESISQKETAPTLHCKQDGKPFSVSGSHLLIATGRKPNIEKLDLEKAGVKSNPKGIEVDSRLRTSNKKIYAMGDVAGGPLFTHWAGYHAGIVIRNLLLSLPAYVNTNLLPWTTYTDPEVAQVGLNQPQAEHKNIEHHILRMDFTDNDRAQAEGDTRGFVKAIVSPKGRILGATIVSPKAGELIAPWVLALSKGCTIGDMANLVLPYPTRSELSKRVAGSYFTPKLFGDTTKKIVRFLMKFRNA